MFEGRYNYTQAAAKCAGEGGTLAMATDQATFDFLYNMLQTLWDIEGDVPYAYVDGSYGIMNTQSSDLFCVNTQGSCPATMPWQPGQPDNPEVEQCLFMYVSYSQGVADMYCDAELMAMCQI